MPEIMAYSGSKKKEGDVMNIRVAVITGGAQGIGKAMVRQFLQEGYAVVMVDHDEEAGKETALEYAALDHSASIRPT